MGLYLAATTLNQAALAQGQARAAAVCWAICAAGFLVWGLTDVLEEARRIEVGFAASALALAIALAVVNRGGDTHDALRPGSVEEIEARLAIADEAS